MAKFPRTISVSDHLYIACIAIRSKSKHFHPTDIIMQDCHFSETQFSFCFTFEFIRKWLPLVILPIFPNTYDEGQEGGGYDVKILGNIFLQFKISHKFYDKVNNFSRTHWDTFGHAYYKIKIDTNHRQFQLLKNLNKPGNNVFYVAPEFHTSDDLEVYYKNNLIERNSAIFPIGNFPKPGSGHHNLIYSAGTSHGVLYSQPINVKKAEAIDVRNYFLDMKEELTIQEQAKRIASELNSKNTYPVVNENPSGNIVNEVHSHLLTNYDIHWYPVTARNNALIILASLK
jgi:hypothetical protein